MEKDSQIIVDIENGLNNIYVTLQELNIKATPLNTKYIFGVYSEIERLIGILKTYQEMGDDNV